MSYVLLVDDNEDNSAYMGALFSTFGFEFELAVHGEEALAKARRSLPLVVVSDLLMPVMDGYTLLRQWKADEGLREIPFVVYTATFTDSEDGRLALDLGADAVVQKSGEPSDLIARLKQVIASAVIAGPTTPRQPSLPQEIQLKEYSDVLVKKLEARTLQLHLTNRALQQEIVQRRETATTQIAVLNAIAAHIALIDRNGTIVSVNDSWRRNGSSHLLHTEYDDLGQNYLELCDEAVGDQEGEARQAADGIRRVLSGESAFYAMEYACHSPTQRSWFRMIVTPLEGVETAGAVVMHVDITDRRGAEQKLAESEAQYLTLLNSTAEGIYRLDSNGVCTFCNPTAARLLGYEAAEDIVGRPAHEHHHHSHLDGSPFPSQECHVHPTSQSAVGTHSDDAFFFRADGSHFPVEYWSYPILGGPDIAGTVVTFLDITQRRNLESQFLQSQKMEAVGRLAGGVAHDFNNALQVILNYGELLEELLTDDKLGTEYNRQILQAGQRAATLTRQLLALSRKQILRPVLLDLAGCISEIEEILRRTIGEHISLSINRNAGAATIEADRTQLQQALINLTINARDAMPAGGELTISTSNVQIVPGDSAARGFIAAGSYALLRVCDTGVGMDPDTLDRIFEPFFTTKDPGQGTGLGLSTVYGIVKQSKGYIVVDSEPGKGADFKLYFPVASGTPEPMTPHTPIARQPRGSETVFLVEDENSLRSVVADALRANGYRVLEAQDGNTAVALANDFTAPIDLLLTDVILPGRSGRNVADTLTSLRPAMKVIYMSGYTDDFISSYGVINAQTVLLEKPFPISLLLLRVRETLDGKMSDARDSSLIFPVTG